MSRMLNNIRYSFFLFLIWFLIFGNQEGLFVTVLLTLCPYSSYSSLYRSSVVMASTFIFVLLIFFSF